MTQSLFSRYALMMPLALSSALFFPVSSSHAAGSCSASASPSVNWQECRKRNLMIDGSNLSGSQLNGTDFSSTNLRRANLVGASLVKAGLARAAFDKVDAKGANFEQALGYRTTFREAQLEGANFRKSEMQRADFSNANLVGVDFEKSDMARVQFKGAKITGTKFTYVNLARANFQDVQFEGAIDFKGAYFFLTRIEGMDLSAATGLQQWQINLSCGDADTKLPEGLKPSGNWPCE